MPSEKNLRSSVAVRLGVVASYEPLGYFFLKTSFKIFVNFGGVP